MAFKQTRREDPKFLAEIRKLRCLACGGFQDIEAHHIKTRGSGGGDDWWNIIPLCPDHHTRGPDAWHGSKGRNHFLEKFPQVWEHLIKLGWYKVGKTIKNENEI